MTITGATLFDLELALPVAVRRYFRDDAETTVVEDIFIPGTGWRPRRSRLPLTARMVESFIESGVTLVTLRGADKSASFRIEHLSFV